MNKDVLTGCLNAALYKTTDILDITISQFLHLHYDTPELTNIHVSRVLVRLGW